MINNDNTLPLSTYLNMFLENSRSAEHVLVGHFESIDVQLDNYGDFRGVHLRTPDGYILDTCHKEFRRADGRKGLTYHYGYDDLGIHEFCQQRYYKAGYLDLDELQPHDHYAM